MLEVKYFLRAPLGGESLLPPPQAFCSDGKGRRYAFSFLVHRFVHHIHTVCGRKRPSRGPQWFINLKCLFLSNNGHQRVMTRRT